MREYSALDTFIDTFSPFPRKTRMGARCRRIAEEFFEVAKSLQLYAISEEKISDLLYSLAAYLRLCRTSPSENVVVFIKRIIESELMSSGYDDESDIEDLLDSFWGIDGWDDDKTELLNKIMVTCRERKKLRHWMGKKLFEKSDVKVVRKCVGCCKEKECAIIKIPGDVVNTYDGMPFCKDCYGKWYYME
jgi:hypothetical protein